MKLNLIENLTFKSGHQLKNRFAKAAMSENMAIAGHQAGEEFKNLYKTWADGEIGLLITGNVMIDHQHLGEANNVVIDEKYKDIENLKSWAKAATANKTLAYVQLNHPGKQTPKFLTQTPVAPSAIAFKSPLNKMFNKPRALTDSEIEDIIKKFAYSAKLVQEAGFTGVQIHGAHGYLVSQFLSPTHNQRTDKWGGSLENRMRFLIEIIKNIQLSTNSNFGVALKINSADFQKGGFSEEDSMEVLRKIDDLNLDFIEISGGTYEATVMMGAQKESTKKREAYFIEYAAKAKKILLKTPLMLTGGFRTLEGMNDAIGVGAVDIIGIARPFCVYPNLAKEFLLGDRTSIDLETKKTGIKALDQIIPLEITWYNQQIHRMGKNKLPLPNLSIWKSVAHTLIETGLTSFKKVRAK